MQRNIAQSQFIEEQVRLYFKTLHCPDQRGGRFCYFPESQKQLLFSGNFQTSTKNIADMLVKYPNNSVFVSLNSYHLKKDATLEDKLSLRNAKNLWGTDCIMIDIDTTGNTFGSEDELLKLLSWYWDEKGFLPKPNLISKTGSGGMHIYYSFERLPKSMTKSVNLLKYALAERFVEIEKYDNFPIAYDSKGNEQHYHVDLKVLDSSRVDRIPGSINPKTQEMCTCYATGKSRYTYQELKLFLLGEEKYCYKDKVKETKESISVMKNGKTLACSDYGKTQNKKNSADKERLLNKNRLEKLFKLAENGKDFYGCRENACFLLCNFSIMAGNSKEKTLELIDKLNGFFYSPLSAREAHAAYPKKTYRFSNSTIASYLNLTPAEKRLMFPDNSRPGNRKEKTHCNRVNVAKLVVKGHSISEISKKLNLSESIVKRVRCEIKKMGGFLYWSLNCNTKKTVAQIVKNIKAKFNGAIKIDWENNVNKEILFIAKNIGGKYLLDELKKVMLVT